MAVRQAVRPDVQIAPIALITAAAAAVQAAPTEHITTAEVVVQAAPTEQTIAEVVVGQVALPNVKTEAIILVAETHVVALALTIAMKSVRRDVHAAVQVVVQVVVNRLAMMVAIRNVIGQESLEAVLVAYQHVRIIAVILVIGIVIAKYKAKWKI